MVVVSWKRRPTGPVERSCCRTVRTALGSGPDRYLTQWRTADCASACSDIEHRQPAKVVNDSFNGPLRYGYWYRPELSLHEMRGPSPALHTGSVLQKTASL